MLASGFLRINCWFVGRLDGVSSDGQGAFGFVDDRCRMTRHLENKKASASLERMWVDCARIPDDGADNGGRHSAWK